MKRRFSLGVSAVDFGALGKQEKCKAKIRGSACEVKWRSAVAAAEIYIGAVRAKKNDGVIVAWKIG